MAARSCQLGGEKTPYVEEPRKLSLCSRAYPVWWWSILSSYCTRQITKYHSPESLSTRANIIEKPPRHLRFADPGPARVSIATWPLARTAISRTSRAISRISRAPTGDIVVHRARRQRVSSAKSPVRDKSPSDHKTLRPSAALACRAACSGREKGSRHPPPN